MAKKEKKYWWENLTVVRQKPRKKSVQRTIGPPSPCTEKPVLKVPCYLNDSFSPKYVYKVLRTPAGWCYTYTYPSMLNPSWASELFEIRFDKYPPKVITKKAALEKLKKHPDAEKILNK